MPPVYHQILQSNIFHVFVGKTRKQFFIHKALESYFPKKALNPAILESVHENIFGQCCEFVYSGDYSAPPPILGFFDDDTPQPENMEIQSQKKEKRWDPSSLTWNLFYSDVLSLNYDILLDCLGWTSLPRIEEGINNDRFTSYGAVFISHAEIHRFGIRTGWIFLTTLSYYRLLRLLANFTLSEERTGDIVQLLELVFEDTEKMDNLENMLRDYVVWNLEMMMRNTDFQRFLEQHPSLEQTVFRAMWD